MTELVTGRACEGSDGSVLKREWRVEFSCCINFSFRSKLCLPREGTVCPGMAYRESGFLQYPALTFVLAATPQTHTHKHISMHAYPYLQVEGRLILFIYNTEHVKMVNTASIAQAMVEFYSPADR